MSKPKTWGSDYVPEYDIFDMHAHPGFEKKGIADRPGCSNGWLSDRSWFMDIRSALGYPDPYTQLTSIDQIPDFSVDHWLKHMEDNKISHMVLCGMDTQSDPPQSWRWLVSNDYIKTEFIDKYPDKFMGIGGINYRLGPEVAIKQVEDAAKHNFLGIKIFTSHGGPPNDKVKCYPLYERAQQLGLHVEIHTGVETVPGFRLKYTDPIFIDDVATDFPDLKIVQLHCGFLQNPQIAIVNALTNPNVYTDVSICFPTWMHLKYFSDFDHFRTIEHFIPDKIFFGTDFPLSLPIYRPLVDHIRLMPLHADFKKKLLRDNARKFFLGDKA